MYKIEETITLDEDNPLLKSAGKAVGKGADFKLIVNNDLESYIFSASRSLSALTAAINKSKLSLSLLDIEHIKCLEDDDEAKSAYIEMLVENCIIRVQSIYDRVLVLVNKILDLGISNESVNHNLLVNNEHVKKFAIESKLKAINKMCNEYRFVRNTVIHHDRYSEEELDFLTTLIATNHLAKEAGRAEFIDKELIDIITANYLGTKKEELEKYFLGIESKLNQLFDILEKVYKYKKYQISKLI